MINRQPLLFSIKIFHTFLTLNIQAKDKVQTRGSILMEMIKLDTVSYTLLDLPAIPYEQYIKIYGRSNMMQVT